MTAGGWPATALRGLALATAAVAFVFAVCNYLIFWRGWPGLEGLFGHLGVLGFDSRGGGLDATGAALGWLQFAAYAAAVLAPFVYAWWRGRPMHGDAATLSAIAAYIARAAFWGVLLVGLVDMAISFLRVEGLLVGTVGAELAESLGKSRFRGEFVHFPLIGVALVIAALTRSIGFTWLAFLIVLAELQIVIARFVFSYEQAFMGDLVRFWYAALFLFASAYTLLHEGHVRVDVLYTGFSARGKAWTNALGAALLGVPLCWVILVRGLGGKSNLINAPLLSFEVSQSGYGMYVKYLMAGFLLIYALSMLAQFLSQFLSSAATLLNEPEPGESG